jgi:glycosyltransferase involved in cell wall biosynthesis
MPDGVAGDSAYALVHLVVQEIQKGLIESQVVDHMEVQATTAGPSAPAGAAVIFLEPARMAFSGRVRRRRQALARRAPHTHVDVLAYVGRLGMGWNARLLAWRIHRITRGRRVVFHCRGETAALWALAIREWLPNAAIVTDVRGIWPEEFLHASGYDSPSAAANDTGAIAGYRGALARMSNALSRSDAMLTVSRALVCWIDDLAMPRPPAAVVPCCVAGITFDAQRRARARRELNVENKVVLAFVGSITRYQHVEDGFAEFCKVAVNRWGAERVHVLCLTPDAKTMTAVLNGAGVPDDATTVMSVPQSQVADYLVAADAGFLLRDASAVNRVSVPVKIGEYLAAGVPVIVSRIEQWVDDLFDRTSAALVVDWFGQSRARQEDAVDSVVARLTKDGPSLRNQALELCRQRFVWSAHVATVRDIYVSALRRVAEQPHAVASLVTSGA